MILKFLQAFSESWVTLLCGVASAVMLVAAALLDLPSVPTKALWIAILCCYFFASFQIWKRQRALISELTEQLNVSFSVCGIPSAVRVSGRDFLVVPDVTITNRSPRQKASIGATLWVQRAGNTMVYCPPQSHVLEGLHKSARSYQDHHISFPLNLDPRETAAGYIAFCADNLSGIAPDLDQPFPGWCTVEFKDYFSETVLHKQKIEFFAAQVASG